MVNVPTSSAARKKMKVADIRAACEERGLDTSGTKVQLLRKLEAALKNEGGGSGSSSSSSGGGGGGVGGGGSSGNSKRKSDEGSSSVDPPAKKEKKVQRPSQVAIGKNIFDLSPEGELVHHGMLPKDADEMQRLLRGIEGLNGDDWVKTLTFPHGIITGTGAVLCDYLLQGCPTITGLGIREEFGENCSDAEDRLCCEAIGRLLKADRLKLLDLSGHMLGSVRQSDKEAAMNAIAEGIASSSCLQDLNLNRCSLSGGPAAAQVLEAAQVKPGGLNRLHLENCGFYGPRPNPRPGDVPAGPPLVALVDSGKVVHLNLKGIYSDPETIIGLFSSVAGGGSALKSLSIEGADGGIFSTRPPFVPGQRPPNPVESDEAIDAVIGAVGRAQCLEELNLSGCHSLASDEVAMKIAKSLQASHPGASLQQLSLAKMCPVVVGRPEAPIVAQKGIGKEGLQSLLGAIDSVPQLRELKVTLRSSRHGVPKEVVDQLHAHEKVTVLDF